MEIKILQLRCNYRYGANTPPWEKVLSPLNFIFPQSQTIFSKKLNTLRILRFTLHFPAIFLFRRAGSNNNVRKREMDAADDKDA